MLPFYNFTPAHATIRHNLPVITAWRGVIGKGCQAIYEALMFVSRDLRISQILDILFWLFYAMEIPADAYGAGELRFVCSLSVVCRLGTA